MVDLSQAKQIEGYTDYWIFPDGRVWSNKLSRGKRGRFLKGWIAQEGYIHYTLFIKRPTSVRSGPYDGKTFSAHRLVAEYFIGPPPIMDGEKILIDHIDRDPSNNHVSNLRYATFSQNNANSTKSVSISGRGAPSSKYKGVSLTKNLNSVKWTAVISKQIAKGVTNTTRLGTFDSEIEAAKAYDKKAYELHGEFAHLNFPDDYR